MKNYTIITKEINTYNTGNNICTDIYIYAYIKLCSNFKTGISNISENKLSKLTGIPIDTIKNIIPRLKDNPKLVKITTAISKTNNEYIKKNIYTFNTDPDNYFFVDNRFYHLELPIKVKGFLLLLKSICYNGTNQITTIRSSRNGKANITEIADKLNLDRKTVTALLNECISLGQIKEIQKGYIITNDCFPLNIADTEKNYIYNTICTYCTNKSIVPPKRDEKQLNKLWMKYNIPENELPKDQKYMGISYQLNERCKTLPDKVTLNYFVKALCNIKEIESLPITEIIII